MKALINFIRGKQVVFKLDICYVKVGSAKSILERLQPDISTKYEVEWNVHEIAELRKLNSTTICSEMFDGYIFNLEVNEENINKIKREFWQKVLWEGLLPIPLAIIIPSLERNSSLSIQEFLKKMTLIRVTDRPWKVFYNSKELFSELVTWIVEVVSTVTRNFEKSKLPIK